jgi:hypothetical protein
MTQEELLDYNRKCAEFLGYVKLTEESRLLEYYKVYKDLDGEYVSETALKFHSDWNWIHEIIEFIEKLNYKFMLSWNITAITSLVPNTPLSIAFIQSENRKEAVVEAIYIFLKWYEQNKS